MIFSLKCHGSPMKTPILARFVASGAAGRATAGKTSIKGFKTAVQHSLGPSGHETT